MLGLSSESSAILNEIFAMSEDMFQRFSQAAVYVVLLS